MALAKCKDCATVYEGRSSRPGLCPECKTRPASADGPAEKPVGICAACGVAYTRKNQRQRFCEKLTCKPVYKPKGVPRSLAPLTYSRAVNAVAGQLMAMGYTEVWQSITGVSKTALVFRNIAYQPWPMTIEVQTAGERSNGELQFSPQKDPASDYRAYVAMSPEREAITVFFDPVLGVHESA